jgi:hypothetical protein
VPQQALQRRPQQVRLQHHPRQVARLEARPRRQAGAADQVPRQAVEVLRLARRPRLAAQQAELLAQLGGAQGQRLDLVQRCAGCPLSPRQPGQADVAQGAGDQVVDLVGHAPRHRRQPLDLVLQGALAGGGGLLWRRRAGPLAHRPVDDPAALTRRRRRLLARPHARAVGPDEVVLQLAAAPLQQPGEERLAGGPVVRGDGVLPVRRRFQQVAQRPAGEALGGRRQVAVAPAPLASLAALGLAAEQAVGGAGQGAAQLGLGPLRPAARIERLAAVAQAEEHQRLALGAVQPPQPQGDRHARARGAGAEQEALAGRSRGVAVRQQPVLPALLVAHQRADRGVQQVVAAHVGQGLRLGVGVEDALGQRIDQQQRVGRLDEQGCCQVGGLRTRRARPVHRGAPFARVETGAAGGGSPGRGR